MQWGQPREGGAAVRRERRGRQGEPRGKTTGKQKNQEEFTTPHLQEATTEPAWGQFFFTFAMARKRVPWAQLSMGLSLGLLLTTPAKALNIQIIVDNDFALFSGTSTSINTLLYQNNAMWGNQLNFQDNPVADAPAGDNYYYLVAMGGSSPEEAFGTIGSLNLTTTPGVQVSNSLEAQLSGYDLNAVTDGTYDVLLTDLQNAFPSLTFSATSGTSCLTVCQGFPALSQGRSFAFGSGTAVLFAIPMEATAVPGPLPLLGVLSALHQARRLRRRTRCAAGER